MTSTQTDGSLRLPASDAGRYSLTCLGVTMLSVVGLVPHVPAWIAGVLLTLFVALGPGCAILAWMAPPHVSRLFLIPTLGLMVVVVVTATAATVGWWSPRGLWSMIALGCAWSVIPHLPPLVRDMVP